MIDFYQIQKDIKDLLAADATMQASVEPGNFYVEAMDRDFNFSAMPMVNVRMPSAECVIRSLPNGYYCEVLVEVDIVTFNLSEFKEAARVRDSLLRQAMNVLRSLPRNTGSVDSWKVGGDIKFGAGTPEQGGGHMAMVTFSVIAECTVDAT